MSSQNTLLPPSPTPYPFDLNLQHLGATETLLLMSLRLWRLPKRFPQRDYAQQGLPDWRSPLQQSGVEQEGWQAMDALLSIILYHSKRLLDIRCTCHQRMGFDEGCFLQVLALIQANNHWQAERMLDEWLPECVQSVALIHAMHLAECLRRSQLRVPLYTAENSARVYLLAEFRKTGNANPVQQRLH